MYCVGQGTGRRSPTTPSIPPLRGTRPVTSGLAQPRACTCVTQTSPASALGEPSINCIDVSHAPPLHRRCQSLVSRPAGTVARVFVPWTTTQGSLPEICQKTALHATSRSRTTPPSAARLTLGFARGREVTRGGTNHPSINGMQGSGVQIPSAPLQVSGPLRRRPPANPGPRAADAQQPPVRGRCGRPGRR
jgi:hypothetical protein